MTTITDESLPELRMQLRGEALTPSDPGYEDASVPFNAMHVDRPSLIVSCWMVIDLSAMRGVEVDPEARIARVQGGALWGDVDRETQAFGLATPGGVVSDTGVAGLTLGGGYGWIRRKYGLSCDNLVAAQVVGADGQVRTASADVNPDLFWAIRGGGGNFGIVTSFTFRLHPLGPAVPFAGVFYPVADAATVLRGYREYFDDAPDEVTPGRADEGTDVGVDDAFGRNLRRLAQVKAAYDPDNFFRRNNNILPAS